MMNSEILDLKTRLVNILKTHLGPLQVTIDSDEKFEVTGTIPAMQGKKKVDGFYFASVVPKPKDVRLYFFAVYTHKDEMGELPPVLTKCLKGKSCFHIKKMDEALEQDISDMVTKAVGIYQEDGLLAR